VQLGGGLDSGHARHRDVKNHKVDVLLESLLDRLVTVLRLGDDFQIGLRIEHLA
jgi:hypothetical protein